jgi:ABC-type transporter Mla subunit MlaD
VTNGGGEPFFTRLFHTSLALVSDLLLPAIGLLALGSYLFGGLGSSAMERGAYLLSSLQSHTQSFSLNVQDANALSQGSPVRFIGVPVGQVDKVWADGEGAHVRVRLKKQALAIPSGAIASVVSFGLAGNRSLEFEPPPVEDAEAKLLAGLTPSTLQETSHMEMKQTFSPYEVERPIRIEETMKVQLQVAKILQTGADNMNAGLFQTPVPELQRSIHQNRLALEQTLREQQDFLKEVEGRTETYHAVNRHMMMLVTLFENSAQNVSSGLKASQALKKVALQKQMQSVRQGADWFEALPLVSPLILAPKMSKPEMSKQEVSEP